MSNSKRLIPTVGGTGEEILGVRAITLQDVFRDNEIIEIWWSENIHIDVRESLMILRFDNDYTISLKKVKTYQDVLKWTIHLLGKSWVTQYEDGPYIVSRIAKDLCALAALKI